MWYRKHKHIRRKKKTSPYFRHWFDKHPVFSFDPYVKIVSIYRPIDYKWQQLRKIFRINRKYYWNNKKNFIIWIKHYQDLTWVTDLPRRLRRWYKLNGFFSKKWKSLRKVWNFKAQSWLTKKQNWLYNKKHFLSKRQSSGYKKNILYKKIKYKISNISKKNQLFKKKLDKLFHFKNNLSFNRKEFIYNKSLILNNIYLQWLIYQVIKCRTQKLKHYNLIKKTYYFDFSNYSKKMLFISNIKKNDLFTKLSSNNKHDFRKNKKKFKLFEIARLEHINNRYNVYFQINKLDSNIVLNTLSKQLFLKNLLFKKSSIYQNHIISMKYNNVYTTRKNRYVPYNIYKIRKEVHKITLKLNEIYLIKQFHDSFNIIYKFLYWYSYSNFNKYVSRFNIFSQKTKYYSYKESYISDFNKNYLYVHSILKCYKTLNIRDEFLKSNNKTKKHYIFFINRISKLSNFNYYYQRYAHKFKIRTIEQSLFLKNNLNINKKLNKLKRLFLTSKKKYYHNSSVSDISFLYYDQINNNNYIDHLDNKYNFFIKKILNKKILNNLNKNNYLNKKKSIYSIINKDNIFSISPLIDNNKYNYIFSFLNIYHKLSNSKKNNFFYSFNNIKLNIFILKNNLFTFFKDTFISKYKFFIYKKYFKRKAFIKKNLSWFEHRFIFDENNRLVTKYDYNKKLYLDLLYDIKYFFKNSYIDWFYYFNGNTCFKKRKSFFKSYKKSYNKFYKKKLFNIRLKKYIKYLIKKIFKNKDTLMELFKEGWLEENPYFDTNLSENEIVIWMHVYTRYFLYKLMDLFLINPSFFNLKKNYSFLKNKKSIRIKKNKKSIRIKKNKKFSRKNKNNWLFKDNKSSRKNKNNWSFKDNKSSRQNKNSWSFKYNKYNKSSRKNKNNWFFKDNKSSRKNKNNWFFKYNKSSRIKKNNLKYKNWYLKTYLNDYCNKIIKSNELNNYYNTQYFQLHNKFLLYKKQIFNKSHLFIKQFWKFNLNNKKINISFIIDTIHSLHRLKKLRTIRSYNILILKYSTLKYFSFREKYFNNLWLFNKRYNTNKLKKKKNFFF